MTRLVFLDTETTGLEYDSDVWEVAMIVRDREHYPEDVEVTFFVEHDLHKAAMLPPPFRNDHDARYDPERALSRAHAAQVVDEWTRESRGAHIVGAVPNFDTERLATMLREHSLTPGWHYHLIDVENLAVGWLHGAAGLLERHDTVPVPLPWDSEALSLAVGVDPENFDRHTALGDARWARDIYDAVTKR